MLPTNVWYVAAWGHEIDTKPLARTICNQVLVLFRNPVTQKISALQDRCCHRGTPLRFGEITDEGIQCGYHGMVFNGEGVCVRIPGQSSIPPKAKVCAYPIVEQDELVWIWIGDPSLADASKIVSYPFHNDHAKWPHKHQRYHVKCNFMLLVDNLMDLTHLAYVHRNTIGGNAKAHTEATMKVTPRDDGLHFIRWLMDSAPPPTYLKAHPFEGNIDRWMEFQYVAPGSVLQWTGGIAAGHGALENRDQPGFSLRVFHGLTPETDDTCFYFWSAANGYRQDEPQATQELFEQIDIAFSEDKAIVEAQQQMLHSTGETGLVDIVSDAARIHMRRTVKRMLETPETAQRT